ncbi:hypothetical protein [Aureivirga marina]|uniref:hypothetical protein n=1 Tax=Aureivirga marina TaxID=1182451 RepID=UPI0018CA77E8|nr:hypothetical protein [Aureivirga marina]
MIHASLLNNLQYNENHPMMYDLLETPKSIEKAILLRKEQLLENHSFNAHVVIEVFAGIIDFNDGEQHSVFDKGDFFYLSKKATFEIKAKENSMLRITQFK